MANREFIETIGQLRVIAAPVATVTIGTRTRHFQVCQIVFDKDGSILVQCPYFPGRHGILAAPTQDPAADGPVTYDLAEGGKLTSHLVKLSHHPDGNVHFSQDGKIRTVVRRKTFPLATTIGLVFRLHIFYPESFTEVTQAKRRRAYLPFVFNGPMPQALTVFAEWRRRRAMEANLDPPDGVSGPPRNSSAARPAWPSLSFSSCSPPDFPSEITSWLWGLSRLTPCPL